MDARADEKESDETHGLGEEDADEKELVKYAKCLGCDNIFVEDAVFCRKCGLRRGFADEDDLLASTQSASKPTLTANFIAAKKKSRRTRPKGLSLHKKILWDIYEFMDSGLADAILAIVVMIDFVMICFDIDSRAINEDTPVYVDVVSSLCLTIYTFEFLIKFGFDRCKMFSSTLDILDAGVLFAGFLELILLACGIPVSQIGLLRLLRVGRLIRLIRVVRGIHYLKELRKLIFMFQSCVKTLVWSFVFCFGVTTIWSMMAVQLINPIVQKLADETHEFDGCGACRRSFSNVMRANLTIFRTVVAGDSWGMVAIPVIEKAPWTAIIFIGSVMSLLYGLLQLVVAVVVDSAAELRQNDVLTLAMDLEHEQTEDTKALTQIFENMDEGNKGELDLDDLLRGAEASPEFQSRLRVMDIDKADLVQLFEMLDADNGGTISPDEFTCALTRWTQDSKTATRFIKYIVAQIVSEQRQLRSLVTDLGKRMDRERTGGRPTPSKSKVGRQQDGSAKGTTFLDGSLIAGQSATASQGASFIPRESDGSGRPADMKNLPLIPDVAMSEHRQATAALANAIQRSVKALHDSTLAAMEHAKNDLTAATMSVSIPHDAPRKNTAASDDEHASQEVKPRSGNSFGQQLSADSLAEQLTSTPRNSNDLRVIV